MTRSIGDDDLKPAVTAEPEIRETVLTSQDDYLVKSVFKFYFKVTKKD